MKDGDSGIIISPMELPQLLQILPSSFKNAITEETIEKFVTRWNDTFESWQSADLTSSHIMNYENLYTGYVTLKSNINDGAYFGSASLVSGLQSAIYALRNSVSQTSSGLDYKVTFGVSRSSVVIGDYFDLTMGVTNIFANMSDINVTVTISERYSGIDATSAFSVGAPDISGISGGITGNGMIAQNSNGTVTWNILALNSSLTTQIYSFSGSISFFAEGKSKILTFYKSSITVYPTTVVHVDYFIPTIFYGDDPATSAVEVSRPATFAMTISNQAEGGLLNSLTIASLTSNFVDSTGLSRITYSLLDTKVYTQSTLTATKVTPSFNLNLGSILGTESSAVTWTISPKIQGKFSKFSTSHKHIDETGNPRTTAVVQYQTHPLYRIVFTNISPTLDIMPSYLTDTNHDNIPDELYNGLGVFIGQPTVSNTSIVKVDSVTFTVDTFGDNLFVITKNPFLGNTNVTLISVSRVNYTLNPANFWVTSTNVYIFDDHLSTEKFTLTFGPLSVTEIIVTLNSNNRIGFSWSSTGSSVYRLLYKKSTGSISYVISDTILDNNYIVADLDTETEYIFTVYAGNGEYFETVGKSVTAKTGQQVVICGNDCENNGTATNVEGVCQCVCVPGICGNLATNSDCSCNSCLTINGTNFSGPCDDGDNCTQSDTCQNGVCEGGENICDPCAGFVCSPIDCQSVTCISVSGSPVCQSTPENDGTECQNGKCSSGTCIVEEESKKGKKSNVGAIVGGVLGGIALLVILAAVGFFIWKKKLDSQEKKNHFEIELISTT